MKVLITALFLLTACSCTHLNEKQNPAQPIQTQEVIPPNIPTKVVASPPPIVVYKANVIEDPWQLKQTQEGIPVYTRKVAGSPILEYKANVTVDAPIAKAIALFEDEKQIHRWYYQCVRSELIENDGPKKEIIYLILHLPWPVASRDFVFRRTKTEDTKNGTISYNLTALPDRLPPVKGIVRVQSIESVWTFKSLPKGKTEIFFQQHTDPVGSIPASLVNQLAVQTPFNSLKNFRRLVTGKDA